MSEITSASSQLIRLLTPLQSNQTWVLEICSFFIFHFPFDIWHLPLPEPIFFNGKCQISNGKRKMKSSPKLLHHRSPDLLPLEALVRGWRWSNREHPCPQ